MTQFRVKGDCYETIEAAGAQWEPGYKLERTDGEPLTPTQIMRAMGAWHKAQVRRGIPLDSRGVEIKR